MGSAITLSLNENKAFWENHEPEPFGFGTICPTCGVRQPHIHHGWLSLRDPGILVTSVHCENPLCKVNTFMIRVEGESPNDYATLCNKFLDDIVKILEDRKK